MSPDDVVKLSQAIVLLVDVLGEGAKVVQELRGIAAANDAALQAETTAINQATRDQIAADSVTE